MYIVCAVGRFPQDCEAKEEGHPLPHPKVRRQGMSYLGVMIGLGWTLGVCLGGKVV